MSIAVPMEGFGGGGTPLNFKVVGYATEAELLAATPKENTIGCITGHEITGYHFAAEQPEEMAEGEMWFTTGTSSTVAFNALKKNNVMVYPVSVKQMVGGTLVDVTAKSYQDGKWVEWAVYLYDTGDLCEEITGGYKAVTMAYSTSVTGTQKPTITYNSNNMRINQPAADNKGGAVHTVNKIDLSNFKTLHFDGIIKAASENHARGRLCIWSKIGTYATDNCVARLDTDNAESIKIIDISKLTGEYYIGFFLYVNTGDSAAYVKMNRMWLA